MKLFRLRSNHSNEDRELRSMGNAPSNRLQSLKFKFFKEYKPDKRGSRNGSSVGDEPKEKARFHDLDSHPLHPANDNF